MLLLPEFQVLDVPKLKGNMCGTESQVREMPEFPETTRVQPPACWADSSTLPSHRPDGFYIGSDCLCTGSVSNVLQTSREHQGLGRMSFGLALATNFLFGHGQAPLPQKALTSPPVR